MTMRACEDHRVLRRAGVKAALLSLTVLAGACAPSTPNVPTPNWDFKPVHCDVARDVSGPSIDEANPYECGWSYTVECEQVNDSYFRITGPDPSLAGMLWPTTAARRQENPARHWAQTTLKRSVPVPDDPPSTGFGQNPNATAIAAGVNALGLIVGGTFIEIAVVDYDTHYACIDLGNVLTRVTTWRTAKTFRCTEYGFLGFTTIGWVYTRDLGWCDDRGKELSVADTPPLPPTPRPFITGDMTPDYWGMAYVCSPIGTDATSLDGTHHLDEGYWMNVSPNTGDQSTMTLWIRGVAFLTPTRNLCRIGNNAVTSTYNGPGYVCNYTGTTTIATFMAPATFVPWESSTMKHQITPWEQDGRYVVMWRSGTPYLAVRADICPS